jgi:hypothetical protein
MVKRLLAVMFALAVIALGSNARLLAHPGHEHKVMGTVSMAAADHIMLKDKDSKELTLRVSKDTKVKSKPPIKVEEIKSGARVVITVVEQEDKTMLAKTIEVGVTSARD